MSSRLLSWLLLLILLLAPGPAAWAGPVEWIEVPATEEGQQWWDKGSLRLNRRGELTARPSLKRSTRSGEHESTST